MAKKKEEVKKVSEEKKEEFKGHAYPLTEAQRLPKVKKAPKVKDRKLAALSAISLLREEGIISLSDSGSLAKKVRVAVK